MLLSSDDMRVLWRSSCQIMGSILACHLNTEAERVSETSVRKKKVHSRTDHEGPEGE